MQNNHPNKATQKRYPHHRNGQNRRDYAEEQWMRERGARSKRDARLSFTADPADREAVHEECFYVIFPARFRA